MIEEFLSYNSFSERISQGCKRFNDEDKNTYIQVIVNSIIEENAKDPHWSNTARAALTGFVNFIVSKVERAKANDYFYTRLSNGTFDEQDEFEIKKILVNLSFDGEE